MSPSGQWLWLLPPFILFWRAVLTCDLFTYLIRAGELYPLELEMLVLTSYPDFLRTSQLLALKSLSWEPS